MPVVNYLYDENIIARVRDWGYGENWPVVYIYYNQSQAYVGETLDAVRRTEQHKKEAQFDDFTNVCYITNKTFNKSVVLDLESFLIKYMSAEGSKFLLNGNSGVVDHNYFYKEAYEDDFKEIWQILMAQGIVKKSLLDIENSELFKYSPYKSLNAQQQSAAHEILKRVYEINSTTSKSLIQVSGGAGTGKTILAVYIIKLLIDINNNKKVWRAVDDPGEAELLEKLAKKISGIRSIGFVVPMQALNKTMKEIFDSIEGLSSKMIYTPGEVVDHSKFDLLLVDEAHRLYRNKHLPQGATAKFKRINSALMGDKYQNNENDLTELDWIIEKSSMQVLFYDSLQSIRTPDIGEARFKKICQPHLYKYIELYSQMRCSGGNGYYEYVKKVLTSRNLTIKDFQAITNYTLKVVDSFSEMTSIIDTHNELANGLCKIVAGPAWTINEDIILDDNIYHWYGTAAPNSIIHSIHKIQGFDLNYAGVVFGREVYYDNSTHQIMINKKNLKDNHVKSNGDENMRDYILNIYLTLMTRGIHGTFVYAMDENLRDYLKKFFN